MIKTFFSKAKLELPLVHRSDYNVITSLFKRLGPGELMGL